MKKSTIVLRKVRNGRVKIGGKWFYAPEPDIGRFDGLRLAFGTYYRSWKDDIEDFIFLWGTEEQFKNEKDPNPIHVEDGILKWAWWNTKDK
jgi:hypothetical protein